jgi:NAD dependent epimerase/dehydratase
MSLSAGTILVTGAGGFIGSHLTEHLVQQGHRVRAFIHYNSAGSRGWLEHSKYAADMEFFNGDIRDFDAVHRATEGCSMVFHLAALIGIPYSYVSPQAYIRTNIDGGYHVLESARLRGLEKVIVTSTSEIYGTAQHSPMDETHPVNCQSPYAATKVSADQLAFSYHRSFGLPVTVARPFNTYGMRQSARALIPTVVSQALGADGVVRLGNLHPRRDLTFVEDVVRAFVAIAGGDFVGEAVHIGSGQSISVGELVELVRHLTGRNLSVVQHAERRRPEASEVDLLVCDNTKICSRTDWRPVTTLEEGLRRTIAWIESHGKSFRPEEYSV